MNWKPHESDLVSNCCIEAKIDNIQKETIFSDGGCPGEHSLDGPLTRQPGWNFRLWFCRGLRGH